MVSPHAQDSSKWFPHMHNILRGDGCVEKPLATLWKNYQASTRSEVRMNLTVCNSGLKASTREHGLTEYWANRITYCNIHQAYPRVFCWVYRHEGKKLKQELRCHAVLCRRDDHARDLTKTLNARREQALQVSGTGMSGMRTSGTGMVNT
ncbi:unnamed protein product, partial [Cyprideis torosa]